jgi:hypothetical protein
MAASAEVQARLAPWPRQGMTMLPANPIVNSPRNQGPECLQTMAA